MDTAMHPATAILTAALCLAAPAGAAELALLSQGLPAGAYSGGEAQARKGNEGAMAFDGDFKTAFCNGPAYPAWVMVDLGAEQQIIKTMFFPEKTDVWYSYRVEVSSDKQAWTVFADQTRNHDPSEDPAYTDMGGAKGRYVRLTLTDARDRDKSWFWPVVTEFQVHGIAADKAK